MSRFGRIVRPLSDREQAEFEVKPGHSMISICVIRRSLIQEMSPDQHRIVNRVMTAIAHWLRWTDAKPGEAKCLVCSSPLSHPGIQSEAYAVGLPAAKMHKRGRTVAMVCGICAACSDHSDDELTEIARKRWAPNAVPTQEGNA
jgi:hypothetical protein